MDYKQKFIEYYQANIHREGADRLLEWLQTTDFFTAPASTRYHCACPSGLVQHSVNVYEVMMEKHFDPETGFSRTKRSMRNTLFSPWP